MIVITLVLPMTCKSGSPDLQFLLSHDAMHKRSVCRHAVCVCPFVCVSVCVSVTFVNCVQTNMQVLSTGSPVDDGHRLASYELHIAGSKRRC